MAGHARTSEHARRHQQNPQGHGAGRRQEMFRLRRADHAQPHRSPLTARRPMIPFHPLAEVLPLLEGREFAELVASIKIIGLLEPITLHEDMILDGRNRYRACLEAEIEPRTDVYTGADPVGFVLSKNIHRRQLTVNQKALAMAQYATFKQGRPHEKTGAGAGLTQEEAAKLAGIGERTIRDAKVVLANGTPAEIAEVKDGKS